MIDAGARSSGTSPSHAATTRWASCHSSVSDTRVVDGSSGSTMPWRWSSRPAYEWYVLTSGSPDRTVRRSSPDGSRRRSRSDPANRASRWRMRVVSCWAALRVKVRPSTSSGRTRPLATIQTTRAAMVSVLPAPAPATTSNGPRGAAMISDCSSVGGNWPRATATSAGLTRATSLILRSPACLCPVPGRTTLSGSADSRR